MNDCPHCGAGPGEMCARLGFCRITADGSSPHTGEPGPLTCECCGWEGHDVEEIHGQPLCDDCASDKAKRHGAPECDR